MRVSRDQITSALNEAQGSVVGAARILGISCSKLIINMRRHRLDVPTLEMTLTTENVLRLLSDVGGSIPDAAALMQIKYNTLYVWIKRHGLMPQKG